MTVEHSPSLSRYGYCACPECDVPVPYRPTRKSARRHMGAQYRRLVYASVFMVAFGLGTLCGLVLH